MFNLQKHTEKERKEWFVEYNFCSLFVSSGTGYAAQGSYNLTWRTLADKSEGHNSLHGEWWQMTNYNSSQ